MKKFIFRKVKIVKENTFQNESNLDDEFSIQMVKRQDEISFLDLSDEKNLGLSQSKISQNQQVENSHHLHK
jgi:hypothetical protein